MTSAGDFTFTVKLQLAILPDVSVTLKVLVVVVPIGNIEPDGRPAVCTVTAPGQLSVPTGVVYVAIAPPGQVGSSVWLGGQVILGGCVSLTVTVNWQLAVLFEVSVAVQVTVVVPFGNAEPDAE